MLLIEVDKARYRRHFNIVMGCCIAVLVVSSLTISQLLILFFPSESGSHFHWNLLGVVTSVIIIGAFFRAQKENPFLTEVLYVWQLKQALNLVGRKMLKLQNAAKMGDTKAMLALQFSYTGSKQLWTLDDNTITLANLAKSQSELDGLVLKYDATIDISQYNSELLKAF